MKIKLNETKQDAFKEVKRIVAWDNLLAYPDFIQKFKIHTNDSNLQLGAVISQKVKLIAFYSIKPTNAQKMYTVT